MRPLVSILTPSFNQGTWLADNLRSVASQTYGPIEHIVMDGGSTDDSVDVLERHARPALRWRSEKDSGQSHALNKAFRESSGEIVGWLNSDDAYCDRRSVEWAVNLLKARADIDVVYGYALIVDEVNTVLQVVASPSFSQRLLRAVNYIYQPTVFVRRQALAREDIFVREDLQYVMDRDLWLRLSRHSSFHRLRLPMAIDRHQRSRKLASSSYVTEALQFDQSVGIERSRATLLVGALTGVYMRAAGLPTMLQLPRHVDAAIALRIPAVHERLWRQSSVRRRRFAYAADVR